VHLIYAESNRMVPHFPQSSLSLTAMLVREGYNLKIADAALTPRSDGDFGDPLFFGITIYSNSSMALASPLEEHLRTRHPKIPLIWGGPHVQMVPEQTARHPLVDAACFDEGELAVLDSARQLLGGRWDPSAIRGLVYREHDGEIKSTSPQDLIDVDTIPYSPYHLLEVPRYFVSPRKGYYQSSRGCPFSWTLCARTQQRRWRSKSWEFVLDHVTRMIEELGTRDIYFSDANFFVNFRRVHKICDAMIRERINVTWSAFCRYATTPRMDTDLVELLKAAGCRQLDIGGESGSDAMLRHYSKGITRDDIVESVRKLSEAGIRPELSFIVGAPMESEADFKQTIALINTLREEYPAATINRVFHYQPYPNSRLGEETIKDWSLPIPSDLEGWSKHPITEPRREYFSRLCDRKYGRMLLTGYIASYLFPYGKLLDSSENKAMRRSLKWRIFTFLFGSFHAGVVKWTIYLRWYRHWDTFPLEWKLFGYTRNKVLDTI